MGTGSHPGSQAILLLAAEDAFESERFQESGPLDADVDPEASAAEVAEFQALGIPMPAELESLRRELEFAPKVGEAIRASAAALRRSGGAQASALVALGPQQLVGPQEAHGWPSGIDPRLTQLDPRLARERAGVGAGGEAGSAPGSALGVGAGRSQTRPGRRPVAVAAVGGPVHAEVLDGFDDDGFEGEGYEYDLDGVDDAFGGSRFEQDRARALSGQDRPRRPQGRPRPRPQAWDEDDYDDSLITAVPARQDNRAVWVLGGIAAAAVLALLWVAFRTGGQQAQAPLQTQYDAQAVGRAPVAGQPVAAAPAAPAPVAGAPEAAPLLPAEVAPTAGPRRSYGGGRAAAKPSSGGTAFSDYVPPGKDVVGGGGQPAKPGETPAPVPGGETPAPVEPAPAPVEPAPTPEPELTKSKMTPAIRGAIQGKVGVLQQCYTDALVGKPDLQGRVSFTISIDQDGVVKKVQITRDEVKYGVAKCAANKIKNWTLPSAGIPIIFDLPFDFKQPG